MSNNANHWKSTLIKGVAAAVLCLPKTGRSDTRGNSGLSWGCAEDGRKSQMIKRKKSTKIYKKAAKYLKAEFHNVPDWLLKQKAQHDQHKSGTDQKQIIAAHAGQGAWRAWWRRRLPDDCPISAWLLIIAYNRVKVKKQIISKTRSHAIPK